MSTEIIVGVLSLLGTGLGTLGGIIASSKLTNYRIAQLEKKADEQNGFGKMLPVIEKEIEGIKNDLEEIKKGSENMK